jgi:DNA repair protein RadC
VIRTHEIQSYFKEIEQLIIDLKTELDLTRNKLYQVVLQQKEKPLIGTNDTCKDHLAFYDSLDDFIDSETVNSKYQLICSKLLDLGINTKLPLSKKGKSLVKSQMAYNHLVNFLKDQPYEYFYILLLDTSMKVIKTVCISEGGISGTVVDLRKLFKIALDNYTVNVILAHNHPSGTLQPSESDKGLTKRIIEAGKLLDINIVDHLIIGGDGYYSFADNGIM